MTAITAFRYGWCSVLAVVTYLLIADFGPTRDEPCGPPQLLGLCTRPTIPRVGAVALALGLGGIVWFVSGGNTASEPGFRTQASGSGKADVRLALLSFGVTLTLIAPIPLAWIVASPASALVVLAVNVLLAPVMRWLIVVRRSASGKRGGHTSQAVT